MTRIKIVHLVWPLVVIYIVYFLSKIIWFDSLSSLANDSVHYLVMARHFSPWEIESSAISSTWLLQDFPPAFPLLLAITGAAHSLVYAHMLVAVIGIISLYFYYLLSIRILKNRKWVIIPVIIFALSPGFLLGLQGILSESFYLLLTFLFFLYYQPGVCLSRKKLLLCCLLLSAILLTRTIGIALCFAILGQALICSYSKKAIQPQSFYIVAISLAVYFVSMATWGPVKESHYFDVLIPFLTSNDFSSATGYAHQFSLVGQLNSMLENWTSFWLIFWPDYNSPSFIATTILLLASMTGMIIRILENKYDAWYTLLFLLILLFWPHPGQMFRLLFPVMPLLLIYAGYAFLKLHKKSNSSLKNNLAPTILYLIVLAAILPTHILLNTRANTAIEKNMIPIYEIFRRADPKLAEKELLLYNQIFKDFKTLEKTVPSEEKIMYFLPSYLAILSNRSGPALDTPIDKDRHFKVAKDNNTRYIFLTWLHPRNSGLAYNGLIGAVKLSGWAKENWCSQLSIGTASCLFTVE